MEVLLILSSIRGKIEKRIHITNTTNPENDYEVTNTVMHGQQLGIVPYNYTVTTRFTDYRLIMCFRE